MKKVIIVGGVAGGASAAARLRRLDESLDIIMFERDSYVSFANCGLPYHIGGIIPNRNSLLVQTPQSLNARFNLDIRINSEVTAIDTIQKTVVVKTKDGQEYSESYDALILSPGAKPMIPPIKGIESKRIFTLRNMDDMDKIKQSISSLQIKSAAVIGGGFIGVESAENLKHLGIKTTLIEAAPHILAPFDSDMSNLLECELGLHGVDLFTASKVVEFKDNEQGVEVCLEDKPSLQVDMVILCIGVVPDTAFLKSSNINLGPRGHILVDDYLKTNVDDVYAIGDAILVNNYVSKVQSHIPLAGPANRQARIAANNLCSDHHIVDAKHLKVEREKYIGSLGTAILKVFTLAAASTGINERVAKQQNLDYGVVITHAMDHASYYPNASFIHIKVLYEKGSERILGAQAVGLKGVDKFIDVLATSIKFNATLQDLAQLELAYAPPFLSAKSPANMVGFIGLNLEQGLYEQCFYDDLAQIDLDKQIIVDVREEVERAKGFIAHSVSCPLSTLRKNYQTLPQDKELIVYCAAGLRGYLAARFLIEQGYKVKNMAGGYASVPQCYQYVEMSDELSPQPLARAKTQQSSQHNLEDFIDISHMSCPGSLSKLEEHLDKIKADDVVKVKTSDSNFYDDVQNFCRMKYHSLLLLEKHNGEVYAVVQKSGN